MHSTLYTFSMLVSPSPTSLNTPNFPSSHQHLSPLSLSCQLSWSPEQRRCPSAPYCTSVQSTEYILHGGQETGNTRYGVCFPSNVGPASLHHTGATSFFPRHPEYPKERPGSSFNWGDYYCPPTLPRGSSLEFFMVSKPNPICLRTCNKGEIH